MNDFSKYDCPKCGSNNTSSLSVEFKRGHVYGSKTTREVVGYEVKEEKTTYWDGHSETKEVDRSPIYQNVTRPTVNLTDLAIEISPPVPPTEPKPAPDGFILSIIKGILSFAIAYFLVSCISYISNFLFPFEFKWIWGLFVSFLGFLLLLVFCYSFYHMFGQLIFNHTSKKQKFEQDMQIYNEQMNVYRERYAIWEKSYICLRCGHIFHVE